MKRINLFNFRKKIAWKTTLWIWILTLSTMAVFIAYIIPYQKSILLTRMNNEATDLAITILHTNSSAFISGELGTVVLNLERIVPSSRSIKYVVLTKKDGESIIYYQKGWRIEDNTSDWLPSETDTAGFIIQSKIVNERVFHKPYRFTYSGIDWGWIHVGLSLENYDRTINQNVINIIIVTGAMVILGLIFSILFARKITGPITELDNTTRLIAGGKLDSKVFIKSGDELENLAESFNKMTDSLLKAYDELEEKVKERTSQLERANSKLENEILERKSIEASLYNSLTEKEVLLKEIHHRVKNNLQIISSLLNLQAIKLNNPEYFDLSKESQNRIKSMALVHEKLYQSKDLSKVDFRDYIVSLCEYISQSYYIENQKVKLEYDIEHLLVTIDSAIPLGLILNELITNSLKYAFRRNDSSSDQENIIQIKIKKDSNNNIILDFKDNGVGLPKDLVPQQSKTLGLKIVFNLAEQIESDIRVNSDNGTQFTLTFKQA